MTDIADLPITVRTYRCLTKVGFTTTERLARSSEPEVMAIPGFGSGSLRELNRALNKSGHPRLAKQVRRFCPHCGKEIR